MSKPKLKENISFHLKYKRQALIVRQELLPKVVPYLEPGFEVARIEVMAAGRCSLGGEEFEFQDIRQYTRAVLGDKERRD